MRSAVEIGELGEEYKIKAILVGDSGVGKSNIRQKLCHNKFDAFSVKTVGVQYSTRKFIAPLNERQQKFIFCLWDVVGDLNNTELVQAYFKNIVGVIYVFDLTNMDSLNNIKVWKAKVYENTNTERAIGMLLGCKKDLTHLREVSQEMVDNAMKEMNIQLYQEVSALSQNKGIQDAFYRYFQAVMKELHFGMRKPAKLWKPEPYHRSCI